jgi:general secretion pathway protein H
LVSHRHRQSKFLAGFTLLELLVVLTIAGLLTVVVPPLYSNAVPGARLKTSTRDFAISLREARAIAVTTSKQVELRLIADPPSYAIGGDASVQLPRGVFMTAYDYVTTTNQALANVNALAAEEFVVRFFPDGSSNGAVIKLANGSTAYRIDVSWMMGDIRVSRVGEHEP